MKVFFIGAGPGASDLITLRGARLLGDADLVLYAGSLIPEEMLAHCAGAAEIVNTAELDLEAQTRIYQEARDRGLTRIARLHSGDPAIYGAVAEQMRRLDALGIEYEVVPGVSTFCSCAAALKCELTKPGIGQTIILTRTEGRASPMPEGEALEELARHRTTMAIFLSGARLPETVEILRRHYPGGTPVALVQKNEWPEERHHRSTLDRLLDEIDPEEWRLSTMLLVGDVLAEGEGENSKLYDPEYSHRFRKGK